MAFRFHQVRRAGVFLLVMIIGLMLSGCSTGHLPSSYAMIEPVPRELSSSEINPVVLEGHHYRIESEVGMEPGRLVNEFMHRALSSYQDATGITARELEHRTVHLYADRSIFAAKLAQFGLSFRGTSGCYAPQPPGAIHVLWEQDSHDHPLITLIHEGVHQFAHSAALGDKQLNPEGVSARLPVLLPLWLNEGIAQFMEGAVVSATDLELGRIHPARLEYLQRLLRQNQLPAINELLIHRYDRPFSTTDYAFAWGVVFALYHGLSEEGVWTGQNRLPSYLERLHSLIAGQLMRNTEGKWQWSDALGNLSLAAMAADLRARGESLSAWEETWRAKMPELQIEQASGGLNLRRRSPWSN